MSVPRQDCDSTIDLLSLSRDQLIKRVLALMRENERLQGEIRRSTDEVADLQFQLLRYQTTTLTEAGAREETKAVTAPATKGGAEEQEVPMTPATPPDAVRSGANSSLLLESPGWGLSTELMSMADALEKDFMLRSTVAQQPEPMPQKQQQGQQPVVKRSVKSQSSSGDGRGNTAAPDLSAHTSPSSTSPAGSVGRRSRLSLQRRKSEAANSDEIQQKAREKEREERERREKKEEEERERREKENEERERREKQERERKEKEERERREKEKTERERREREVKEKEERERREKKEKEERERERREREKKKEKEERERERREKEKTEQEEKERKRKEKEEHEANEKAREKQKRSEAMSASGVSRGQAKGVPPGGQTGGPDSRASRPTGLKEGKRAIDETREDVETAQAPHASRPPATPTEESRSPTKKQKVDDQQDEGALYLDGINLLRAEQNYEDGRTSTTQPAKRPKSLKKQLEEERLQRDYRSIRSFFSFNAKKPAADGVCSAAVSPRLSPPRQIAAAATSPPRTEPADPPPAPAETAREGGGVATADPPQEGAMTDQERKKLARSRARAASDPKKTPRFVFGENCPGCATWMSKSDITSGMQDTAEASQTRCASCKHVFAPSVEVTFSVGREQKEDRKERVHFFDKVRLEAVAKERYKQGGRKSFTITLLAEERTDLFWNLVYHFGSLKDAVCAIFPTLNWNAVFRPSPKTT